MILDTDIGGDPDDIFALLLALASPEEDLDLVVTSNEHKGHRASFAQDVVEALDIKADIIPGLSYKEGKPCMVCDIAGEKRRGREPVEEIAEIVENRERVKYVAIGPQTNLARFMERHPELVPKLEVTCMGGAIDRKRPEYNLRTDLEASRTVLNSEARKRYITLDVTAVEALELGREHPIYQAISKYGRKIERLLEHNAEKFRESMGDREFKTHMHDPLALSVALGKDFVDFEEKKVDLGGEGGMALSEAGGSAHISIEARQEKFMDFLEERINKILQKQGSGDSY